MRHIRQKGAIDLVTEFDVRSEEVIISALQKEFPEHAILAEESGHGMTVSEYQWVIDPLDGTTNFAHGIPIFSVTMSLMKNNSPVVGVVYDPLRDEMFSVEVGQGATLNDQRIQVSSQAKLGDAVISTGFPYDLRTNPCCCVAKSGVAQQALYRIPYPIGIDGGGGEGDSGTRCDGGGGVHELIGGLREAQLG